MNEQSLNAHERELVEQLLPFLTHDNTPSCQCCGFSHGMLETLIMVALEETNGNLLAAEKIVKDAIQAALEKQRKEEKFSIRSFSEEEMRSIAQITDTPGFCEQCGRWHPFFDIVAAIILCGMKTKEEIETAVDASIRYIKMLIPENQE